MLANRNSLPEPPESENHGLETETLFGFIELKGSFLLGEFDFLEFFNAKVPAKPDPCRVQTSACWLGSLGFARSSLRWTLPMQLPTTDSNEISLIYLHIPKCGGSFVQKTFSPYSKTCPTIRWEDARGHLTYNQYARVFKDHSGDIHGNQILTVVRNPWAWHVSWYNYVRRDRWSKRSGLKIEHKLFRRMSFDDYLNWLDDDDAPQSPQGYLKRQQSDWICDDNGHVRVDHVLHQENLLEELLAMIEQLKIDVSPTTGRVNVSTKDDYRKYYSQRGIDLIASRHWRDCKLFGYEFSNEDTPSKSLL